jgi:hypothetical protein
MSDAPVLTRFPSNATDTAPARAETPDFGRGVINGLLLSLPLWGLIIYGVSRLF